MTIHHLLNPLSEDEDRRIFGSLHKNSVPEMPKDNINTHEDDDDDDMDLSLEDDTVTQRESSMERADEEDLEVDNDDATREAAFLLANLGASPFSPAAAPSPNKALTEQKVDRIMFKIRRLVKELALNHRDLPSPANVVVEARKTLRTIHELKIIRKTVNQTAATVSFVILKNYGSKVTLVDVVEALKKGERLKSLSRSTKPVYSRNQADVLGISKLVTSFETHPTTPFPEATHSKTCQEATVALARALGCDDDLERLAVSYSTLSEQSSMASRHKGTVAASCVLHAAKISRRKLTLVRVSEVSGVSTCTIRKSLKALESLTKDGETADE